DEPRVAAARWGFVRSRGAHGAVQWTSAPGNLRMTSSFDARRERADTPPSPRERRRFLVGGLGLAGAAAALAPTASRAAAPLGAAERTAPADPSKVPGYPMEDESYGA